MSTLISVSMVIYNMGAANNVPMTNDSRFTTTAAVKRLHVAEVVETNPEVS